MIENFWNLFLFSLFSLFFIFQWMDIWNILYLINPQQTHIKQIFICESNASVNELN